MSLRERESALVASFPAIPWLEPQPVAVGETSVLTCRLCTALHGLKAQDVAAGRVGFVDVEEHSEHLERVHAAQGGSA